MIESRYWKEDLLAHANRLKPVKKPARWSERVAVNFEKELMISFFMVRAILEHNKTSGKSRDYQVPVRRSPWNGKPITQLNFWDATELYHFQHETGVHLTLPFLANQFVHAKIIYAGRDKTRNWSEVLLCSDYEIRRAIYRVSIEEIRKIFFLVGTDYTQWINCRWDEARGDWRVTHG